MAIDGIQGGAGRIHLPMERGIDRAAERRAPATGTTGTGAPARESAGLGLEPGVLPKEAPPGTDPELWSVLTTEERAYYARAQALGPLTYRPGAANAAREAVGRGGRIDIRV
jgi:hypothetical protein